MVTVELDIFSGRPNPRWTLSEKEVRQLTERVRADPSLMLPLDANTGGLGYRGFILSSDDMGVASDWQRAGLPSKVRLGGAFKPEAIESSSFLLHTAENARLDLKDPGAVLGVAEKAIVASDEMHTNALVCYPAALTSDTDFSFWNGASYMPYNNCYNFAANYRTNTFAQPGRASGSIFTSLDCSNIGAAAVRDGWKTSTCRSDANYSLCLVIWPGTDFHWYRLAANGHWCHKPGQTAARNYDNSGNWILDPNTCNRGNYTIVCGYYFGFNVIVS